MKPFPLLVTGPSPYSPMFPTPPPGMEPILVALSCTSSREPGTEDPRVTLKRFHRARELQWLTGWYDPVGTFSPGFPSIGKECQALLNEAMTN